MELVVIIDMLAVLLGCATAGSRGLFALARDRRLPSGLGRVSSHGTPLAAGIVVMAGYAVAILVTTLWTGLWASPAFPHYVAMFNVLSAFGSLAMACVYFLLSLGAFHGLADYQRRWVVALAAVVGMAVTGAAIFGAVYEVAAPVAYAPAAAAVVFAIGLVAARRAGSHRRPVAASGVTRTSPYPGDA